MSRYDNGSGENSCFVFPAAADNPDVGWTLSS
jgi:hypothetical protein